MDFSKFSQRTNWTFSSNPLMSRLEDLKKRKVQILDLTESNPTQCGFSYLNDSIIAQLAHKDNVLYVPSAAGLTEAREVIREYYRKKGKHVALEQLFLTSSTSEAYSVLLRLLLNVGEKVLVPAPSYPLFEYLVQLNDNEVNPYPLIYDGRWRVDTAALAQSIDKKTRAIILVNPNNPTGSFVEKEDLNAINSLAQKHNLAIICDEVFLDYSFETHNKPLSLAASNEVLTFVLGGISKSLGLPQMKLAWIAASGPKESVRLAQERLEVILDTYLSVNTPSQRALAGWFQRQPAIQKEILERLVTNKEWLKKKISSISSCQLLDAQGGWYSLVKLPEFKSEEEWVMDFLQDAQVFTHPGYFFDFPDEPYIVLSLLSKTEIFEEGVSRILKKVAQCRK